MSNELNLENSKKLVESINKSITFLRKNIVTLFKSFYEEPIKKITYPVNITLESDAPTIHTATISIEPKDYGNFDIRIKYEDGDIIVDYEDDIADYYYYNKYGNYEILQICYTVLNEISNNIKKVEDYE